MSGLDHLTAKILEDARKRASEITGAAEAQAKSIVDEAVAEANREKDRIMSDAQTEAKQAAEQVTLGKTLAIRDQNLDAKQQILEKVFAKALEELNAMPDADYKKFLVAYLSKTDCAGQEIILPKKRSITVEELNKELSGGGLTASGDSRDINGGFILCKDGIDQNNTFEALISYYRYELESEVLKMLY